MFPKSSCRLSTLVLVMILFFWFDSTFFVNGISQADNVYRYRVDQTLKIVHNELVTLNRFKLYQDIDVKCSRALNATFTRCFNNYQVRTNVSLQIESLEQERLIGCCAIWNYQNCVVNSVRTVAHYSLNICNENDLLMIESDIDETIRKHSDQKKLCLDYRHETFYCRDLYDSERYNVGVLTTMFLGFVAIVLCLMLIGYQFFRYLTSVHPVYLAAYTRPGYYDDIELVETIRKH